LHLCCHSYLTTVNSRVTRRMGGRKSAAPKFLSRKMKKAINQSKALPKLSQPSRHSLPAQDVCPSKHRVKSVTVQMALSGSKHFNPFQRKTKSDASSMFD